jgi:hypothetical protein
VAPVEVVVVVLWTSSSSDVSSVDWSLLSPCIWICGGNFRGILLQQFVMMLLTIEFLLLILLSSIPNLHFL